MDTRLHIPSILTVVLAAMLVPHGASAQSVRGRVFDAQSGSPVAAAEIVMRQKNGDLVVTMMTTDDGSFSSDVGRKGKYVLTVSHLGYDSTTTVEVSLGGNEDLWIEIELAPQAIDIPGLTVVTQSQYRPRLEGVGYYQRRRKGIGTLFEPLKWEQGFRVPLDEMLRRHTRGNRPCPLDRQRSARPWTGDRGLDLARDSYGGLWSPNRCPPAVAGVHDRRTLWRDHDLDEVDALARSDVRKTDLISAARSGTPARSAHRTRPSLRRPPVRRPQCAARSSPAS